MARKPNLDMDKLEERVREVSEETHKIFVVNGWTWGADNVPTVDDIVAMWIENLKHAITWWKKSGQKVETLSCGRLRVSVYGDRQIEQVNFMVEVDTYRSKREG